MRRPYLADQKAKKFRKLRQGKGGGPPPRIGIQMYHANQAADLYPLGIQLGTGKVINVVTGDVLPKGAIYRKLMWSPDVPMPRGR